VGQFGRGDAPVDRGDLGDVIRPADLIARALEIARRAPLPLEANLAEIGLVNFSPLLQRATFPLTG
jgi:hypothetical protein